MYYPLLRGRQNELLAIRELLSKSLLSDKLIPIIEPVKLTSTLVSTVSTFSSAQRRLIVIRNPQVGAFLSDIKNPKNDSNFQKLQTLIKEPRITRGLIVGKNTPEHIQKWASKGISEAEIVALCLDPDCLPYYESAFQAHTPQLTVAPYVPAFRRMRDNRILLDDKFNKKARNSDYLDTPDEFFSDDHRFYADDRYAGFSDYSIVGKEYSESGFAPYAVVVHMVYFDEEKNLRIHHFVSIDNDDISDPAGKFYQALERMIEWNQTQPLGDTLAMRQFQEIYEKETYPGLGTIKKLSIMHHLELMSRYLDGAI